jgi:hypothetical protein
MALEFPPSPAIDDEFTSGGIIWTWDGTKWVNTGVAQNFLPLAGGTLTGPLFLQADPSIGLGAATKQYVDTFLPLGGGTLTGPLFLAADPTFVLGAATKQYVDEHLPLAGGTLTGPLILAADPTDDLGAATKQYVDDTVINYLPLSGGTLTGPLTIDSTSSLFVLRLNKTTSTSNVPNSIVGTTAGSSRWAIDIGDNTNETGNNSGSNFNIVPYTDAGVPNPAAISISRSDSQTIIQKLVAPGVSGTSFVINGDMRIDQRNSGGPQAANIATNQFWLDRWVIAPTQAGRLTFSRNLGGLDPLPATGFPYYFGFRSLTAYTPLATDYFVLSQFLEADSISDLRWGTPSAQPVTLSFWVYSSLTGTFGGNLRQIANLRNYIFSYSVPVANTWTKIVITIPGDVAGTWVMSGNGGSLYLQFDLGSGANYRGTANAWLATTPGSYFVSVTGAVSIVATINALFYITGIKLETGIFATPFVKKSLSEAMVDCQRYYQYAVLFVSGYGLTGTPILCSTMLPVLMRAAPTLVVLGNANGNLTNFTLVSTGVPAGVAVWSGGTSVTATGNYGINVGFSASADI